MQERWHHPQDIQQDARDKGKESDVMIQLSFESKLDDALSKAKNGDRQSDAIDFLKMFSSDLLNTLSYPLRGEEGRLSTSSTVVGISSVQGDANVFAPCCAAVP